MGTKSEIELCIAPVRFREISFKQQQYHSRKLQERYLFVTHSYRNQGLRPIAVSNDVLEDIADANEERLWRQ